MPVFGIGTAGSCLCDSCAYVISLLLCWDNGEECADLVWLEEPYSTGGQRKLFYNNAATAPNYLIPHHFPQSTVTR